MARPLPTTAAALAVLAATREPEGSPLSARTRRRLEGVIDAARAELLAAVAAEGAGAAASRLGVDVATLRRWRAPGGWLHAAQGDDAG
jgi:hypothetical protein